ncbi:MAG TPA: sigma-54 dependent transcriptional regulator [Bryobacteraceae bacterium]|jgi:two-component system response regulator AtoC|nr:sigma-54 dependent transcriptional regulator [Bryobacteraceae bacterium]
MTPPPPGTILVADDDFEVRDYFQAALQSQGFLVQLAEDGEEALRQLEHPATPPSLVLLDVMLPGRDGVETLKEIRRTHVDLPVILISSADSWPYVVSELGDSPAPMLEKPVPHYLLIQAVWEALESGGAVIPRLPLVMSAPAPRRAAVMHGSRMRQIENVVKQLASFDVPVLVVGETGVGKEVIARRIHAQSRRSTKPFLKLNCAALPSELVESELFGYQRGAFTGAFRDTPGKFEQAQGGTIMLDEIGDMDVRLQAKLLQVLQDGEFQRLGSRETVRVDVRVMAATHRDLRKAIRAGSFREDLFYRLNIMSIEIPPLRDRKDEIASLADHFLRKHAEHGNPIPQITPDLRQSLLEHRWPGNVRELENLMRKYLVVQRDHLLIEELKSLATIEATDEPEEGRSIFNAAKRQAGLEAAVSALEATRWNRKEAAGLLKMDYKTFLYHMKKLGISGKKTLGE